MPGFFTLDPFVLQDFIPFGKEFLIKRWGLGRLLAGQIGHEKDRGSTLPVSLSLNVSFSNNCDNIRRRMKIRNFLFLVVLVNSFAFSQKETGGQDWRQWRGPNGNGTAADDARPPLTWGAEENVRWKVPVPGRGLSSPIVVGDLVILTSATDEAQWVIAYDRSSGAKRWETLVHEGGLPRKLHRKNSAATPTPVSDGRNCYVVFHNEGRIMLTALDQVGGTLWQKETGQYECDYGYGYAPSPTIFGELVIVSSEFAKGGYLAAFRKSDGEEVWRTDRKVKTSYSSPIVARVGGRDQLLLSGADLVSSYDPVTGRVFWQIPGSSKATCGTMVWSEDTAFASGGFPNKETIAVQAGVKPAVLWRNGDMSYEQSLLYHDGHVYTLNDGGIAVCWEAATGVEKWKVRLGGPVSASPVFAGGRIYAMNEQGMTFVFSPDPEKFTRLAGNQLGVEGFATPAFVGDAVFLRTADAASERQEWLYCLGED